VLAYQGPPRPEASLLLAGDVMLGRAVEDLMRRKDPFRELAPLLRQAGAAAANLEGPIAAPVRTGPLCFHFPPESAGALARAGFTHLHLANNHALDQGRDGLDQTRGLLRQEGLEPLGDPSWEAEPEARALQLGPQRVFLVPWNATGPYVQLSRMAAFLGGLRALHRRARIVVAVHWGTEYRGLADPRQTSLGRALVDAGADLVVGHHPHVVQNIERHRGGLIFHSLGNLVFDQWRREETRDGLLLKVSFPDGALQCELLPLEGRRAQPRLAEGMARSRALAALAAKSSPELGAGIQAGLLLSPK
jgi:poly-gamma-glutamate synthesis protein (capsule biosynthesis protein)